VRRLAVLLLIATLWPGVAGAEEEHEEVTSDGARATNRARVVIPPGSGQVVIEQSASASSGDSVRGEVEPPREARAAAEEPDPEPRPAPLERDSLLDGTPRAAEPASHRNGPDAATWVIVAMLAVAFALAYRRLPRRA